MELRIVDPGELVLLKENARFFKRDTFNQLVENLKKDKKLSSVPLCRILPDGRLEVVSGNHRIKASIQAKIKQVFVMVILREISQGDKIAIQLSHNSLTGEDDVNILSSLWSQIQELDQKIYAGLSSDIVKQLENIELVPMVTPQIYTRFVTFVFTDPGSQCIAQVGNVCGPPSGI